MVSYVEALNMGNLICTYFSWMPLIMGSLDTGSLVSAATAYLVKHVACGSQDKTLSTIGT